jgi:hypothetical protein
MSSEEMRNELESFVNRGLREGWVGWPMKSRISASCVEVGCVRLGRQASITARLDRSRDRREVEICNGYRLGGVYSTA